MVGEDFHGNRYYIKRRAGEDKREVHFRNKAEPDPSTIAVEWDMWLRQVRPDPPTKGELARAQRRREEQARRGAEVQARDKKRKLQVRKSHELHDERKGAWHCPFY